MHKNWKPISSADFDQNYQPINRTYPAATGSTYVVKAGDSLYAIAGAVWGDVSMWYLIAEANGITAETPLTPNQTLTIPNKVTNIHNNSGTSRPYDAGAIISDLSPTLPDAPLPAPPPQKSGGGCGAIGMIIMVVIAVVVTIYAGPAIGQAIYGAATGTTAAAAGTSMAAMSAAGGTMTAGAMAASAAGMAAGAALGSIASQMAGVAMGMQDKINWKAVGTSALSAAIMPNIPGFGEGSVAAKAATAAVRNIAGQGIAMATGQQEHFSWKSVAVSAISAPVMSVVRSGIAGSDWAQNHADLLPVAQNAASALVSSTVGMVVTGGRMQWAAVAADAISSTIADSMAATRTQKLDMEGFEKFRMQKEINLAFGKEDGEYLAMAGMPHYLDDTPMLPEDASISGIPAYVPIDGLPELAPVKLLSDAPATGGELLEGWSEHKAYPFGFGGTLDEALGGLGRGVGKKLTPDQALTYDRAEYYGAASKTKCNTLSCRVPPCPEPIPI